MSMLKDMLSSGSKVSSKRVITFASFVLMGVAFLSNLFFDFKVEEFMFDSMMWIVVGGLGMVASEQFGTKKNPDESEK